MTDKTAFLFDLDGVLIDTEKKYTLIWRDIDREFPTGVDNFPIKIKGTTLENILDTYFPDPSVREAVVERLYEREAALKYDYTPGALSLLRRLCDAGVATALVTSSNELKLEHLWRELPEMKGYFDTIIDGDMVTHSKPDPEGYTLAAKKLGVDSRNCVVLEDSLQGVKAGRQAGGLVIGVEGTIPVETLRPYCDFIVASLEDVDFEKINGLLQER